LYLDSFTRGGDTFNCTVLEFASGGEFFEHIQQLATNGDRLHLDIVKKSFLMIASGVACIHDSKMCHLDLSLENIIMTKDGVPKICDFGLAREGEDFSLATDSPGKLPYMSPELFNRQVYTSVFFLGC